MAHNNHPASDAGTSALLAVEGLPFTGARIRRTHTHWLQLLRLICCTEGRLWRTTSELRTGCGAQQTPRLGCGHHCKAGCSRLTFRRDAYLSHTQTGCISFGLTCCTADRQWRTTTTPPPMRAPLHSWLLAASHKHWLQLLGLSCCTAHLAVAHKH